jgi:hypothetical protein
VAAVLPKGVAFDTELPRTGAPFELGNFAKQRMVLHGCIEKQYCVAFRSGNTSTQIVAGVAVTAETIIAEVTRSHTHAWLEWLADRDTAGRTVLDLVRALHLDWLRSNAGGNTPLSKQNTVVKNMVKVLLLKWISVGHRDSGDWWPGQRCKAYFTKDNRNGVRHSKYRGATGAVINARASTTDEKRLAPKAPKGRKGCNAKAEAPPQVRYYSVSYDDGSQRELVKETDIFSTSVVVSMESEDDDSGNESDEARDMCDWQLGRGAEPEFQTAAEIDVAAGTVSSFEAERLYSDDPVNIAVLHAAMFTITALLYRIGQVKPSVYFQSLAWLPFLAASFTCRAFSDYGGEATVTAVKHFVCNRNNRNLTMQSLWRAGTHCLVRW